jgi:hypothetical protein
MLCATTRRYLARRQPSGLGWVVWAVWAVWAVWSVGLGRWVLRGGRSSRQQQQVGPPQLCTLSALYTLHSTLCTLHSALCTQPSLHSAFSAASLPLSPCQHHLNWADTTMSAFKRRLRAQAALTMDRTHPCSPRHPWRDDPPHPH